MNTARPIPLYLLLLLHFILGTGAFYGGWHLITDPIGFGMKPEWLAASPFSSYLIPGVVLLLVNGVFPMLILWGLFFKPGSNVFNRLNIYADRHWAWTYSLFSGIMLIGWINVQMTMVPFFWLQPVFLAVGLLILILTLWPSVMRHYLIADLSD